MFWFILKFLMLLAAALAGVGWVCRGVWGTRRRRQEQEAARRAFGQAFEGLGELFREAAQRTGKPRGLVWERCELDSAEPLYGRDRATGLLYALSGATIAFSAVEGGDMEEVEAVGNLRGATAVFVWRGGRWETDGRALFNLEPHEAIERYAASLDPLEG